MDARVRHRDTRVNTKLVLTTAFFASPVSSILLSQGFQTHLGKSPLSRISRTRVTGTSSRWRPSPHPPGQRPRMAVQGVWSQMQIQSGSTPLRWRVRKAQSPSRPPALLKGVVESDSS